MEITEGKVKKGGIKPPPPIGEVKPDLPPPAQNPPADKAFVLTANPKRAIIVTVPREKELKQLRAELLAALDQIERYLNISPSTAELRQRYKDDK